MEPIFNFMEEATNLVLTTPFAVPLIVLAISGAVLVWIFGVAVDKAQEMGQ